ncbi:MAG TPA: hypothetical protein VL523_02370 [Terriglobia bacterium]|nr:hypothetical protein [Terriglobia bacterium]
MGLLDRLRGIDRRNWHVCYNCMMQTGHDTAMSVFYSEGPPTLVLGRPLMVCPRCGNNNTKSFQALKDEGSEAPLWGLEQTVRKHPRSQFIVKPQAISGAADAGNAQHNRPQ